MLALVQPLGAYLIQEMPLGEPDSQFRILGRFIYSEPMPF